MNNFGEYASGQVFRLTLLRRRSLVLTRNIGAVALLAAVALSAHGQVTTTGNVTVFDTITDVNVRVESGNTTLAVNGVNLTAGSINYNPNSVTAPTGPISMSLDIRNTTVNSPNYGGVNLFTNLVGGNDITVLLDNNSVINSSSGSGGVWVRNEKAGAISIITAAAVTSAAGDGVTATSHDGNISLQNSGAVTATASGGRALYADSGFASATPVTVSMVNSGTLNSDGAGMRAINYKGLASIENSGSITSATRQGLIAWTPEGDVSITNQAAGVLTANTHNAIQGATQVGNVTLANHGQAIGLNGLNGAAGFDTSEAGSGNVTITNTGTVQANGGTGILASTPSGNITITNSGTVTSTATGISADTQSGTVSITNSGSITGSTAIQTGTAATTIVNSGTISGGIAIGSGNVTLELRAGSNITGNVAKSGATSNVNTLVLGGSADASFDVSTLGNTAQYRDFANLNKTGTSTWTLTGASPGFGGHVNVQNGTVDLRGTLNGNTLTIEGAGGNEAKLIVDGQSASLSNAGAIQISRGTATNGSLILRNGAQVETVLGGLYMGAGGTVDLSGSGTALRIGTLHSGAPVDWNSADGWFSVDEGTVRVTNGAVLDADGGYIGGSGATVATMTVDGAGTAFNNGLPLYVGGTGNGTVGYGQLTVSGGASVTATTSALGVDTGSEGTLNLSGAGTTYSILARNGYAGNMRVGYNGTGTATVENGASLSAAGLLDVASQADSRGDLTIRSGGQVSATSMKIGGDTGARGSVVVDGTGSSLTIGGASNPGSIQIARTAGATGSLTLTNGAQAETVLGSLYMGAGGTVDLSGSGTALRIGTLHAGAPADWNSADGWFSVDEGTVRVTNGAVLDADGGYIGGSGATVATMTVDGAGTAFNNGLPLYVGGTGNGTVGYGRLTVSGGASVTATTSALGVDTGSEGTLNLSGAGTTYSILARNGYAGNMRVGYNGTGTATVESGASLSAAGLLEVASQDNSRGTLTVQTGGQVSAGTLRVGVGSGAQGSLVVNGSGSSLTATSGTAGIGVDGQGSLSIGNGGLVTTQTLVAGWNAGGTGTIDVTGANSRLNSTAQLHVGVDGAGTLNLANGGAVTTNQLLIATNAGSIGTVNIGAATGQQAAAAGTLTAASIELGAGNGRLVLNHTSGDYTLGAGISGTGAVNVLAGTTTFSGNSGNFAGTLSVQGGQAIVANTFAASSTTVSAGATLQVGTSGQVGALVSNLQNDGAVTFANSNVYAGQLSGRGLVAKTGSNTLLFSGDSRSFTGTTNVTAGGLLLTGKLGGNVVVDTAGIFQVGDGSANGDLLANTVNNGTLIFNQTIDYDYTGALSGNGKLIKQGSGLLLLSGDYHYKGSTVVLGGLVRLASALDTATDLVVNSGTFDLANKTQEVAGLSGASGNLLLGNGRLTVNQAGNSQFGGTISGTDSLIKNGAGTLNLTGASTFTGGLTVNQGLVAINGVLPGSAFVNQGGRLGGNGTVGSITVRNGGSLTPGNSIGQISVTGDVTFEAGSTYAVEVDANGNTDRVNASGRAKISGGTVAVTAAAGNYRWITDYVILHAGGGVSGQFAGYNVDLPFLTPYLRYTASDVVLTLARNDRKFASFATTRNQRAVATTLDGGVQTDELYRAIAGQADANSATQAFDALSGELWSTTGTFLVDRTRRIGETMLSRLEQVEAAGRNVASAAPSTEIRPNLWVQGLSSWNKVKSDGNAAKASQRTVGVVVGGDAAIGQLQVGAAFNHGTDETTIDGRASRAEVTTDGLALYAGRGWGKWRTRAGASYHWHTVTGTRNVNFTGVTESLAGDYDARGLSAFGEASYGLSVRGAQIEPFAGVNHVSLRTDAFAETGGELAGLSVSAIQRDVTYTTLGLRLGSNPSAAARPFLTPRLSAAWLHGFGEVAANGRQRLLAGGEFDVWGLPAARNALRVECGAQVNVMRHGALGLTYVGNVSNQWSDHGLRVGFSSDF